MDKNKGILGEMIQQLGEEQAIEQFKIIWHTIYSNNIYGPWSNYKFPAFGNILNWLYALGSFNLAENATIGDGIVKYHSTFVASYLMDKKVQRPVFKFVEEYNWLQNNQDLFIEGFKRPEYTQSIIDNFKNKENDSSSNK
jgi:hypothetical protein